MSRVRAEADASLAEYPVELFRALDDGRQVGVVAGDQVVSGRDIGDAVERRSQLGVVGPGCARSPPGATADDQAVGAKALGELCGTGHAMELVGEDVVEDEVAPGVDAHELHAGLLEQGSQLVGATREVGHIAIEHLHALIAEGADVGDRLLHRAGSAVEEVLDAGDAGGVSNDAAPGDRVVADPHSQVLAFAVVRVV